MAKAWFEVIGNRSSFAAASRRYEEIRSTGLKGALLLGLQTAAQQAEAHMVQIINNSTGMRGLSDLTGVTRGGGPGGKPLISSSALINSIKANVDEGNLTATIGVARGSRGKGKVPLWNIALMHELGTEPYLIEVTPKMYGWMLYMRSIHGASFFLPKRPGLFLMHPGIPARPFIQPTLDWMKGGVFESIFRIRIAQILRG